MLFRAGRKLKSTYEDQSGEHEDSIHNVWVFKSADLVGARESILVASQKDSDKT